MTSCLRIWIALVALLSGVAMPVQGGDARDQDRARQALEAGEILPLRAILERVERDTPGQVVEIELEREHGRWLYEIKVLRTGGSLVKLTLDARDGTVLARKGRGAGSERRDGDRR